MQRPDIWMSKNGEIVYSHNVLLCIRVQTLSILKNKVAKKHAIDKLDKRIH